MEKILKIGDTFNGGDGEMTLHSVIEDETGGLWAIGLDAEGVPYIYSEDMIEDEQHTVYVCLPDNLKATVKKKGKK